MELYLHAHICIHEVHRKKFTLLTTKLHGVISHEALIFPVTAVKTQNSYNDYMTVQPQQGFSNILLIFTEKHYLLQFSQLANKTTLN